MKQLQQDDDNCEREKVKGYQVLESFNKELPCASYKLKLSWDSVKERKIVSCQDISFGELIMVEQAFVKTMGLEFFDKYCHYCWKDLKGSGTPCLRCDQLLFCSTNCRDLLDKKYHSTECGFVSNFLEKDPKLLLVARMLIQTGIDKALKIWKNSKNLNDRETTKKYESNYESVLRLKYYKDDFELIEDYILDAIYLRMWLEKKSSDCCNWSDEKRFQLEQLILIHFYQIKINLISIPAPVDSTKINSSLNIGYGLFPTIAMFNHSCKPDIFIFNQDNHLRVYTAREIKAEQEIFFCYDASIFRHTYQDRKERLKLYRFECKCQHCLHKYTSPIIAYQCQHCHGPLFIHFDDSNSCSVCKSCLDKEAVKRVKKLVNEAFDKEQQGNKLLNQSKLDEGITLLSEAYNTLFEYLHRHNLKLDQVRSSLISCLSLFGHYDKAAKLSKLSAKVHQELFGLDSVEYGQAQINLINMKLCELQQAVEENQAEAKVIRNEATALIDDNIKRFKKLASNGMRQIGKSACSEPFQEEIDLLTKMSKSISFYDN